MNTELKQIGKILQQQAKGAFDKSKEGNCRMATSA